MPPSATQGARRQEVSGCPSCSSQAWPAHGCWTLIRKREPGRSLRVAGYVTFGSLVLSEVSLPLCVAEGCPSVCVLALRARPPGCSVCHLGAGPAGLASFCCFSLWLLGDAPGGDVLELWQAGLQSFVSLSQCRQL